jgi:hypothetical protein
MRLAACALAMAIVWLAVLPALARIDRVQATIARNEALGIDASAKFYSELPAMPRILRRMKAMKMRGAGGCGT